MSEETPQKGWDSWFDVPSNASPGDDEQLAEQSEVQATPAVQPPQETREIREIRETPETPEMSVAPEPPKAQPAAETRVAPARHGRVYGASAAAGTPAAGTAHTDTTDEANAAAATALRVPEQASHWTAPSPSMGQLLEGQDAQATQVVKPGSIPAQAAQAAQATQATPSAQAAQSAEPTQSIQSVQPTQFIQPVPPPDSASAPGRGQGYGHGHGSAPLPGPDALPTQRVAPQPLSGADAPTAVSSVPPPAAPPIPAAPAAAPAWQTPQPAQMWGEAPRGYPQAAASPPRPPQGPADDQFAGWDEQFEQDRPRSAFAPTPAEERIPPRSRKKLALASGIATVGVVGLVAVLVFNNGGLPGSAGAKAKPSGFQPTATTTAGEAEQTAEAFLAAWQSGNFASASQYTDDPAAALSTLTSYRNGLNLNGLQLTAQSATANAGSSTGTSTNSTASTSSSPSGTVSFSVAAKVGLPATSASTSTSSASSSTSTSASAGSSASTGSAGTSTTPTATANWAYTSTLTAYEKNGGWWVKWTPALVAPNLTASEKLVSVAVAPTASEVTDASGSDLSGATDVGVKNIAAALKKNAPTGQGTPGVEIELEKADGTPIPGTTDQLSQPVNTGVVKTTINSSVEAAAQAAVLKYAKSSMVVIRPSTGEILAVANNNGQNDFALTARVAPGSTNKIITTTALLTSGLVTSTSQAVECPKTITVNGTTFANSQNESEPASTPFLTDFAVSCNNAFGQWYTKIGSTTLAQTAQQYYGLNQQWNIGLGEAGPYYTIPSSSSNGELFQELFGQGQLEASPLAMASVAATVDTGNFKQPIVVPGQAQVSATALPSTVQQELKQLMYAVTQSGGTAAGVFDGVNSTVYGKTGTADVGGGGSTAAQANPNSWMVVFDPTLDLAIGCVVLDAGYGASYAGPETAAVLKALQ